MTPPVTTRDKMFGSHLFQECWKIRSDKVAIWCKDRVASSHLEETLSGPFTKIWKYKMDFQGWTEAVTRYVSKEFVFCFAVKAFPYVPMLVLEIEHFSSTVYNSRFATVGSIITVRKTCTVVKICALWQLPWAINGWGESWVHVSKLIQAWKLVFYSCSVSE